MRPVSYNAWFTKKKERKTGKNHLKGTESTLKLYSSCSDMLSIFSSFRFPEKKGMLLNPSMTDTGLWNKCWLEQALLPSLWVKRVCVCQIFGVTFAKKMMCPSLCFPSGDICNWPVSFSIPCSMFSCLGSLMTGAPALLLRVATGGFCAVVKSKSLFCQCSFRCATLTLLWSYFHF